MAEWNRLEGYTGLMFREHPTRRHGPHPDRLYGYRMQVDGKRRFETIGWASAGWTPKKALVEMERLREAAKSGTGPASRAEKKELAEAKKRAQAEAEAQKKREAVTLKEYFDQTYYPAQQAILETNQKKARSVRRDEENMRLHIAPVIGNRPIKDISCFDVERVSTAVLKAGKAPRTAGYCLATIRQTINHAINTGAFVGNNPVKAARKPKTDNKRERFLTEDEADRLLDALAEKSVQVRDMALLSLHCGLRAGEIFALTWANVDMERGTLSVRDTKSGKNRVAFMTESVRAMLDTRNHGKPSEFVFPAETGGKIGQISQTFVKTVTALGLNAGVTDRRDKLVFHTLRHTFASWLVQRGVDLFTVQKLMGHETMTMTQRYAHLAPDHLQAAVKIFEAGMDEKKDHGRESGSESAKVTSIR